MKYSPKLMKQDLEEKEFHFKKKFGQNFIIDENIVSSIVTKAQIDQETLVIEVGPGAGSLTAKLVEEAKNVLCYEIDHSLENILKNNLKNHDNYEILYQDFLRANVIGDIQKYKYKKLYVVANLPYYITTPIIMKIIEDQIPIDKIVVMVQKEVGDRFKAIPGTKEYNSLSIYLNYYFNVRKVLDISKNVFMPKPNVDSIVVEFTRNLSKKDVKKEEIFFALIRDSFTQKRKTLRNNLKKYSLEKVEEILKKYGYDLSVRAENLSIDIFIDIANHIS